MSRKSYGLGLSSQPNGPGNELCRSSRVSSTTSRHPSIILPPSDSRRSVNRTLPATQKSKKKRTRSVSTSVTEASDQEVSTNKNSSKNQKKKKQKKKTTTQVNDSDSGSIIDLREDSEPDNSKIPAAKPCAEKYDSPLEFFGEPFYPDKTTEEERKKKPITYNCKWCKKRVRGGHNSDANLQKHRDGSNQAGRDGSGCPNRILAIQAGAKLPPTVNQTKAQAEKNGTGDKKLTSFFGHTEKFDKKILNQNLMIWQTRNALPWSRIEDIDLQAGFHYCQPDAILFKRKWVAAEAKQLYISLQGAMLQTLKKSSSKFTLVHDAWTTKGNRYAFIGSSVAYINDEWEFNMMHLSLKLVSWFHQGKWLAEPLANVLQKHGIYPKIRVGPWNFPILRCYGNNHRGRRRNGPASCSVGEDNINIDDDSEPEHDEEELSKLLEQQEKDAGNLDEEQREHQATNRNESNSLDRLTKKV
ncbi:hypothetical protein PGTUg99_022734 [Puccinia graminis f. sp. tritici]|uniref:BED-type domain-containing protein n=1 Tax=Puccinia graminis f. sp. tritici TaxID=56615 RepID=A0A5B0NF73_PUCGR|nr:hypothetical protein PGTUg99_022734 [Puccinia graminis f. sp. tritici]